MPIEGGRWVKEEGGGAKAGSSGNVQGATEYEPQQEGLGGVFQQIMGRKKQTNPNAAAYNEERRRASEDAASYGNRARNYTQEAAQIDNQYRDEERAEVEGVLKQQRYSADQMRDIMSGKDVTGAQALIRQGVDDSVRANMAMARSAKGPGQAAGAMRAAGQNAAEQGGRAAAQAGQLQSQLAMQAAQVEAQTRNSMAQTLMARYGMSQAEAIQQAQLMAENQRQQNAMRLGYGGLGLQAQGLSQGALDAYTGRSLQAQGLGQAASAQSGAQAGQAIGTIAGVAGAMMMSDVQAKTAVAQEGFRAGQRAAMASGGGQSPRPAPSPGGPDPRYSTAQPGYGQDVGTGLLPQGPPDVGAGSPVAQSPYVPPASSFAAAQQAQALSPVQERAVQVEPPQTGPAPVDLPQVRSSSAQMAQAATKASPALSEARQPVQAMAAPAAAPKAAGAAPGLASYMSDEASKILADSESSSRDALNRARSAGAGVGLSPPDLSAYPSMTDSFKSTFNALGGGKKKGPAEPGVGTDEWAAKVNSTPTPDYQPMGGPPVAPTAAGPLGTAAPAGTNTPAWLTNYMGSQGAAAPAAAGGFSSDVRGKKVDKKQTLADDFLDGIRPLSYHYKQLQDEPRPDPTGGRYLGVTAQDLEGVPEVGRQLVEDTPRGKQVLIKPTLSAALAGLARMNERLRALEGKPKLGEGKGK